MEFEYKVLGQGTVQVAGNGKSLVDAMKNSVVRDIEDILNALGAEGWEAVTLDAPYIFKRAKG